MNHALTKALGRLLIAALAFMAPLSGQQISIEPIAFGMHRTAGGLWRGSSDPASFAGWGLRGGVTQGKWQLEADFINMRFFGVTGIPNRFTPEHGFSWAQHATGEAEEFDTDYGRLALTYQSGPLEAYAGKLAQNWGPGLHAITISQKAPTFPQFGFNWRINDMLRFRYLHGDLFSTQIDAQRTKYYGSHIGAQKVYIPRHLVAHRLEITPVELLTIGFTEQVVYGARGLELGYLLPFIPYWHVQHYLGDTDNVQMSADITLRPRPGVRLYGVFLVDEWKPDLTFEKINRNWFAWQGGLTWDSLVREGDQLLIEGAWTDHRVYRHRFYVNDTYSHKYPLGHWIGPHAQSLQARYIAPLGPAWVMVSYIGARRGELTRDMLEEQYATEPYVRFSGPTETVRSLELTCAIPVSRKLWLEGGINRITWENAGFDPTVPYNTDLPDVTKTSLTLGFYYNFDLPGYAITQIKERR